MQKSFSNLQIIISVICNPCNICSDSHEGISYTHMYLHLYTYKHKETNKSNLPIYFQLCLLEVKNDPALFAASWINEISGYIDAMVLIYSYATAGKKISSKNGNIIIFNSSQFDLRI